jgi:DegV family protein with EDD domain
MADEARHVKVVTDSAADIPPEIAADLDITVIPLVVRIGDHTFRDGVDISGEQFYRELAAARSVTTTSLPSLDDFEQAYRKLTTQGFDVVSVHMSSRLSGTFNAALMASTGDGVPPDSVDVIDSRTISMAQGWVAIEAAEAALEGEGLAEVTAVAERASARTALFGALETLEYVIKSGRVGKLPGTVGTMLSIKPILTTQRNGEAAILEKVRTRSKAIMRVVELTRALGPLERVAVMHAADPEGAEQLRQMLLQSEYPEPVVVAHIGAVLGTHIGPGGVGVCALRAAK